MSEPDSGLDPTQQGSSDISDLDLTLGAADVTAADIHAAADTSSDSASDHDDDLVVVDPRPRRSMAARIDMKVQTFDDSGDTLSAKAFVADVDAAVLAGGLEDGEAAGLARRQMRGDAKLWIDYMIEEGTDGYALWTELRPIFLARYCKQLTLVELEALESQLKQKDKEKAKAFMIRVKRFIREDEMEVTAQEKATAPYRTMFNRRAKKLFIKGLRQEIRLLMTSIRPDTATEEEILDAAGVAELLLANKPDSADKKDGKEEKKEAKEIAAIKAALPPDAMAIVDAVERISALQFRGRGRGRGRGNRGNNGGGRGGNAGGGGGAGGAGGGAGGNFPPGGPSLQTLQNREKALCGCCNKMVKHRTNECFKRQGGQQQQQQQQQGRGGGRGGGQQRNYAQAAGAGAAYDPNNEFEPLN